MNKTIITTTVVAIALASGGAAIAQDKSLPEPQFFGVSVGAKGQIGGNYLTDPKDAPSWAPIFEDGAGGIGGGGGLYAEFRVLEGHLGLEFDVLFESNKNWASMEYNNVVDTDWITRFKTVRMPLLVEGSLEGDRTRVSLGVGPEFVVGIAASTDIEVTEGSQYVQSSDLATMKDNFHGKKQTDTFLCAGLGLAFKVWKLAITLDLRYSYNLTQPDKYTDRVSVEQVSGDLYSISTIASSTMDMRILLGIAYELGFDL